MKSSARSLPGVLAAAMAAAALAVQPLAASAAEGFKVSCRSEKWKTITFEDGEKAEKHFEAATRLGCEARQEEHEGHFDVSYRCPKWKEMTVRDHDLAHKWEKRLKKAGFETRHAH